MSLASIWKQLQWCLAVRYSHLSPRVLPFASAIKAPICNLPTPEGWIAELANWFSKLYHKVVTQLTTIGKWTVLTSKSGRARRALKSVIVLPEPGGPQRTIGLCSNSHVDSSASCRTVSMVGITTSGAPTLWVSTSTCGTFADHGTHSPLIDTYEHKWSWPTFPCLTVCIAVPAFDK